MLIPAVGLDVGFGYVKVAKRSPQNANLTQFESFPSLAPRRIRSDAKIHDPSVIERIYHVNVNGVEFSVGPDVKHIVGGASGSGRALNDDYPRTVNYEALFLGGLALLEATEIGVLVMGLPVHTIRAHKEFVTTKFCGEFEVADKVVKVNHVHVIPQPIGAILHYGESVNHRITMEDNFLVNDFGYGTTDWVTTRGMKTIESRSGGTPIGGSTILKSIADLISQDIGKKYDEIERIDDAIIYQKDLKIFGYTYTPTDLKAYLKSSKYIADDCANKIKSSVGDGSDLNCILNVGGGSLYFGESIEEVFGGVKIETLANPRFCVASGLLEYGESQMRKQNMT
ncbi:PRTRC system protein D [Undibacterium sp. LX40W]|uniref:PRTRC system protein D n=1 Tax=Undibacterium nitidum TaxID=2762298 RepID=A0A923KTU1_9BURK|nr:MULTISPECIES: PRTRC system protein D [Undibacterium]MBC3881582.1 PRTRC system protein D [Undibacterium nitidum]MBC3891636.1 PRTRC system protein D [Undibacterium sp. LX40W]